MSRTYKDRPYWVRSNDPREDRVAWHSHDHADCDIHDPVRPKHQWRQAARCTYYIREPWWQGNPSHEDVRDLYYGPERRRMREVLGRARKSFNGGDEDFMDDHDVFSPQHRQGLLEMWG